METFQTQVVFVLTFSYSKDPHYLKVWASGLF